MTLDTDWCTTPNKEGKRGNETCCGNNTCIDGIETFTCKCPKGMVGIDCCSSKY